MQEFLTYRKTKFKIKPLPVNGKFLRMMSLVSELGLSISLPIVGGAILGQFLDNKFQTGPKLTLSLIFLGLFLGSTNVYLIIKKLDRED